MYERPRLLNRMRGHGTEWNGVVIGRGGLPLVKNKEELIAQALSQLIDEFGARSADVVDKPCPGGDPCAERSLNSGCLIELNLNGGALVAGLAFNLLNPRGQTTPIATNEPPYETPQ